MIIGPKYKICRRLGDPVFGKCQTGKFAVSAQRKQVKRSRPRSEYGTQLLEKQKVRYTYGLTERMLSNYVKESQTRSGTNPSEKLFNILESRLDNVLYRLGMASSRTFARQIVSHGHVMVNGKALNIPSHRVRKGDIITIRPQSQVNVIFKTLGERLKEFNPPRWLALDTSLFQGTVLEMPGRAEKEGSININEIIGFYSRV